MRKANRLINEKSLYLKQHAYNPVDWFPWGEEALKKAREENKPLFISIGYSSCHWCHVMERESFEDREVAEVLNENFVSVKVDREERPDVDRFYMEACQAMTGSGGWPLTVVATPDGKPFFAATYLPKRRLIGVLKQIAKMWREERDRLIQAGDEVVKHIRSFSLEGEGELPHLPELVERFLAELESRFDEINGGFSPPPKFPQPHNLWFLVNLSSLYGKEKAFEMAAYTLKAMRAGGIYDQIGGGFHRYSVDAMWFIPHFEKMLYDQAGLLIAYSTAYGYSGYWLFRETVEGIFSYLNREMRSQRGTFYSAQDADTKGVEGGYYLWKWEELKSILTAEELEFARHLYNLSPKGNYEEGYNLPFIGRDFETAARELKVELPTLLKQKKTVDEKLLAFRERNRQKPARDEKILVDWNGYLLWGLSAAARILKSEEMLNAAETLYREIVEKHGKNGELPHVIYGNEIRGKGLLDDYAFSIRGILELYLTKGDNSFIDRAVELTEKAISLFFDREKGNFFITVLKDVPLKQKELLDEAYPSANGVMLQNLSLLFNLTGELKFREILEKSIKNLSQTLEKYPAALTSSLESAIIQEEFQTVEGQRESIDRLPYRPYRAVKIDPLAEKLKICQKGVCRETDEL